MAFSEYDPQYEQYNKHTNYVIKLNLPQASRIMFTKKCRPMKITVCPIKIENQIQVYKKKVKKFNFFIFYD